MRRVGIDDQIKSAIQDVVAPALHELRGEIQAMRGEIRGEMQAIRTDIQRLDQKIDGVDQKLSYMKGELVAEIRRLDARIDGVDRELRTAIDIRERLAARGESASHSHERPNDRDVDLDRPFAPENAREHADALLGEGVREGPAATPPAIQT